MPLADRKPSNSSNVGGSPVKSRLSLLKSVSLDASSENPRPSDSSRDSTKASIGLATRSAFETLGIAGLVGGMGLEYWASVIEYPMNIGGRPFFSWPAFIIPAYETTIMFAAGAAVFGMLALNGLPEPYHPVFNVPGFALASRDKFFICIEAADPKFDRVETARFLKGLGASVVSEVEH